MAKTVYSGVSLEDVVIDVCLVKHWILLQDTSRLTLMKDSKQNDYRHSQKHTNHKCNNKFKGFANISSRIAGFWAQNATYNTTLI